MPKRRSISFRYRLLASYLIFTIIVTGLLLLLVKTRIAKSLTEHVIYSSKRSFSQTYSYLGVHFARLSSAADILAFYKPAQALLSGESGEGDIFTHAQNFRDLYSYTRSVLAREELASVKYYLSPSLDYSGSGPFYGSFDEIYRAGYAEQMEAARSNVYWIGGASPLLGGAEDIALIKRTVSTQDFQASTGFILIAYPAKKIQSILEDSLVVPDSITYLHDEKGEVILASAEDKQHLILPGAVKDTGEQLVPQTLDGKQVLFMSRALEGTNWRLTTVIDVADITGNFRAIMNEVYLAIVIIGLIMIILSVTESHFNSKRIIRLIKKMSQINHNEEITGKDLDRNDEIGQLSRTYNKMLVQIRVLLEETYEAGVELKNTELKLLQAQINPHFLYNTLDTINWLAQKNDIAHVDEAISSLAKFYRTSLSDGLDEIAFSQELEHIESYVAIQNIRFNDSIQLIAELDPALYDLKILKMIMQPIIENAILHGIIMSKSKSGSIVLEGNALVNGLVLYVHDDGAGIADDALRRINGEAMADAGGYGIHNIRQRIQMFYSPDSSLVFYRNEAGGVTAKITLIWRENDATIRVQ